MTITNPISRRASLVTPASSGKMLEKAMVLEADELIIDLEDAVLPAQKTSARETAVRALSTGDFAAGSVTVRVNSPGSDWIHDDLMALAGAPVPPASVIVPKVGGAGDLVAVDRVLRHIERSAGDGRRIGLQVLIETARGLWSLPEICASSERLEALILGYVDLAASLGRRGGAEQNLDLWLAIQEAILTAARATNLQAIDGPEPSIHDEARLREASLRTASLGFDGKWAIHPAQLSIIKAAFTPSSDELERARAVLRALEDGARTERGVVLLNGQMLDEATRTSALRTLARGDS